MTGAQDAAGTSEAPAAPETAGRARRRGTGLSGMLLPELQRLAAELGIPGTGRMRKSDLVAAISERQVSGSNGSPAAAATVPAPQADDAVTGGVATSAAPLEAPISGGANGGPVTAPAADTTAGTSPESTDAAPTGRR